MTNRAPDTRLCKRLLKDRVHVVNSSRGKATFPAIRAAVVEAFNAEAKKAGWDVRLEQLGPALPDILYKFDGPDVALERRDFRPAPLGAGYVQERWRRHGLKPPPNITLRLHHESAKRNGKLVPAFQGPVISKPSDGKGWPLEYRPAGGLQIGVGDVSTIKLKRGEWLSDTFTLLWLLGDVLRDAPLWATGVGLYWAEQPAYQKMFQRLARQRWDRVLRKRVFWQRFDQVFTWSDNQAEQAQIRLGYRDFIRLWSSDWWVYHKPWRPSNWNLKDYREWNVKLRLKTGGFRSVDRQKGDPVRNILVTPALAIFYLWLWRRLLPTREQRRLETLRRYYKTDCWLGDRSFDTRASAYLQLSGVPNVPYGRFDQRPRAYLHPEHAPKRDWRQSNKVIYLGQPRDYARLEVAIVAYVFTVWRVARNKNLLANIQKLPPKDRLSALEIETGGVRLAEGISPEQWVRSRIHRYYLLAFLATCAVAVAIASLTVLKSASYVRTLTIINNEYRQLNNGESLSGSDLEHIQDLLNALVTRDSEKAKTTFKQLSEAARSAYQRAYPSAKDLLTPPGELSAVPLATSTRDPLGNVEPSHDILHANDTPLNSTISAAIDPQSDADFFAFILPGNRRDIIDLVVNNKSTTFAPTITVYKPDKGELGRNTNSTFGGDVSYSFAAQPNSRYYVRVSPYSGASGSYELTIRAQNAFDEYEPNDDILSASLIKIGRTISANNSGDVDYYQFDTDNNVKLVVFLENRSTTFAPTITVYKPDKGELGRNTNSTSGGDVSYSFAAQPNSRYYVRVSPYSGASGKYALTVHPE